MAVVAGCLAGVLLQKLAHRERPASASGPGTQGVAQAPVKNPEMDYSALETASLPFEEQEDLSYCFSWNGIPGATFLVQTRIESAEQRKSIVIRFSGATLRTIDWAWEYRMEGVTYVNPDTLLPWRSTRLSVKPKKQVRTVAVFDHGEKMVRVGIEKLHKGASSSTTLEFSQGLDMGSALLYTRCFDWTLDHTRTIELVDGKSLYVLEMTPVGEGEVTVAAGTYDAVEVDLKLRKLTTDPEDEEKDKEKYRKVRTWLARDEDWLPVLLQSEVFVGSVCAELVKVGRGEPQGQETGGHGPQAASAP